MKKFVLFFLFLVSTCFGQEHLELLIGPEEIAQKIQQVANQINQEYEGKELTVILVMKGSICVGADFIRQLTIPCTLDCMKASSYGQNGMTSGELKISGIDHLDLKDKHVLVIDDIFDTGKTMSTIIQQLQARQPKSLKSLVLLVKNVPRKITYRPDYILFEIEDHFVVGFGLDYKEYYRGLPGIYQVIQSDK